MHMPLCWFCHEVAHIICIKCQMAIIFLKVQCYDLMGYIFQLYLLYFSDIWGLRDYLKEVLQKRKQKTDEIDRYHGIKRRKLDDGKILIEMPVRFIR